MQIGIVGLGRAGGNIARRLAQANVAVIGFDADRAVLSSLAKEGVLEDAASIVALTRRLAAPRVVLMRVPGGRTSEIVVQEIWPELERGDLIVDAGHAHYRDCAQREAALASAGIRFIDCGIASVSERADDGYAVMFGGVREAATMFEPYARILARRPDMGWLHCGRCGSGQFVHMIRRAIEAGMHEAYSEGLALIEGRDEMRIDASRVVEAWRSSGIPAVFAAPVASGAPEGHWAAIEAIEQGRPAPVMSLAIAMRAARWNEMESATP